MSPPPPVAVTVPCAWQVTPSEAYRRKCAAVPAASALRSSHVPLLAFVPLDAAAIQSDGSASVASTVPLSAPAQLAGAAPVRILRTALTPIVDSTASSFALRTATLYCNAIVVSPL